MRRTIPPSPDSVTRRSFVGWADYLTDTADVDAKPGPAWASAQEAEEALTAEFGQVPTAEFFDFGSRDSDQLPLPQPDDDDDGEAGVLRVLR